MRWRVAVAVGLLTIAGCGVPPTSGQLPSPSPSAAARHIPLRLKIPALGLDAMVETVRLNRTGGMAAPVEPDAVGWYEPGVAPGEAGDAVIDGYVRDDGVPRGPFSALSRLRVGDGIEVEAVDGEVLPFTVVAAPYHVPATAQPTMPLFQRGGQPRLSLITCGGRWDRFKQTYMGGEIVIAALAA
jgi:sortase (surface protein transpeptidase)